MDVSQIRKRDGTFILFNKQKIVDAVWKAMRTVNEGDKDRAEEVADQVIDLLNHKFRKTTAPTVEEVQDGIEEVLILNKYVKTSKAYILYRKQHNDVRRMASLMNTVETIEDYINQEDWRVKENANMTYSLQGLNNHIASIVVAEYWLDKLYPSKIANAHRNAEIHIHDLSTLGAYCVGWDLQDLLMTGFTGVEGKIKSNPPKHLRVALGQIVNYIYTLQGETAGAQAFSNFDTLLAPFIRYDGLDYKQVKQAFQEFLFNMNVPTRVGFQTPFSNITMDLTPHPSYKNSPVVIAGKMTDDVYGDFQEEMNMINQVFAEVMIEGDAKGSLFTFPIPTYNITKDFNWDSMESQMIFEMTAKYGIPYFSNFINSDMKPEDARSMCLHASEKILYRKNGEIKHSTIKELSDSHAFEYDGEGWSDTSEDLEALSLNPDTMKLEWKNVLRFVKIKRNETVGITTQDGKRFKASENHLVTIITPEGLQEKFAKDITIGDYVLSLKNGSEALSKKVQKIGGDEVLDKEMAAILGFFTADGNFLWDSRYDKRKIRGLQFSFNFNEPWMINEIKSLLEKRLKVVVKEKKDPRYNTYYLYIYSSALASKIYDAGFKKHGKLPNSLFNSPKEIIKEFLDYFFKGDGYERRKEIHINDLVLSKDLTFLYNLIGVPTTYIIRENSQVIYLQHRKKDINTIGQINSPCLHECVPGFMAKSTYLVPGLNKGRMVSQMTLQKYKAQTINSEKYSQSDIYITRVSSIQRTVHEKEQEFYDIELEDNHLFVHSLGTITHNCCRLRLDNRELRKRGGGLFGANPLTGSIGVVTVNLPRIGYLARTEEEYFEKLDEAMDLAYTSLEIKRKVLENFTEKGLYPYSKFYLRKIKDTHKQYWKNHFSTIGLIGMNESLLNMFGSGLLDTESRKFAIKILDHMRKKLEDYQLESGNIFNLEATPAEGTTYRLAKIDKKQYPNIIVANEQVYQEKNSAPYYTNSTQLHVASTIDLFDALEIEDELQTKYTGGTVFHTFLGEKIQDWKMARELIKRVAENFKLPYFTLTPTFSICPIHGYISGEHSVCPKCDEEIGYAGMIRQLNSGKQIDQEILKETEKKRTYCEVYSRVVGYIRPVKQWNAGKVEEYKERKVFDKNL